MKPERLSFLIALFVVLGLFFAVHSFKAGDGQAQASSVGLTAKLIGEDARYSAAERRSFRRTVLSMPDGLLSLNGGQVRAVFNQPELVRRDLPTIVWQYRNAQCVLDVYFTARAQVAATPVVHYEVRARGKDARDEDVQGRCLQALVRERAGARLVTIDRFYKAD